MLVLWPELVCALARVLAEWLSAHSLEALYVLGSAVQELRKAMTSISRIPYMTSISLDRHYRLCHFISDIMDYFFAGEDQQQTNQPNDLASG